MENASSPLFSCTFVEGINHNDDNDHCNNDSGELLNTVTMCQVIV